MLCYEPLAWWEQVGSCEVTFEPKKTKQARPCFSPSLPRWLLARLDLGSRKDTFQWHAVQGSFSTNPKTAGAITLTVQVDGDSCLMSSSRPRAFCQAALLPLAFAGGTSEADRCRGCFHFKKSEADSLGGLLSSRFAGGRTCEPWQLKGFSNNL